MAFTKAPIVESIQNQIGLLKNRSLEIIETLLEIVNSTLESRKDVMISGFGKFCVKKNERKGRNPTTGDAMMLEPRKVVTFKCSDHSHGAE